MSILSLHGFLEKAGNENRRALRYVFPNVPVISPYIDYTKEYPEAILRRLKKIIHDKKVTVIVGQCLGAYYAVRLAKRTDDSIEINKVMAISVFKRFRGLKMIGMAINRFPYYGKGTQKRIEVKEKAKAAAREHIRYISALGWAEVSDDVEKIFEKSLPWAKYDIAPEVLINNSVFQDLSMDLDGMHYYRTLHRNQVTVRIGAYRTLQDP